MSSSPASPVWPWRAIELVLPGRETGSYAQGEIGNRKTCDLATWEPWFHEVLASMPDITLVELHRRLVGESQSILRPITDLPHARENSDRKTSQNPRVGSDFLGEIVRSCKINNNTQQTKRQDNSPNYPRNCPNVSWFEVVIRHYSHLFLLGFSIWWIVYPKPQPVPESLQLDRRPQRHQRILDRRETCIVVNPLVPTRLLQTKHPYRALLVRAGFVDTPRADQDRRQKGSSG